MNELESNLFPVFESAKCHHEKQEWITTYRRAGLNIFPTYMKRPLIYNWQEVKPNEQIAPRVHDIGAVCGIQFEVLDLDCPTLVEHFGHLSSVVKYGKQGRASYFFKPSIGVSMHGAGWDFLSVGTFTVLPPSRHPSGIRYKWFQDYFDLEALEPIDPFILNELQAKHYRTASSKSSNGVGRNFYLTRQAALYAHNGMDVHDIARAIFEDDIREHAIPWLTDPSERHRLSPSDLAMRIAKWAIKTISRSGLEIIF